MDVEMANLRVKSDWIDILKVELNHGIPVSWYARQPKQNYNVTESTLLGAKCTNWKLKEGGNTGVLDNMFTNYKPYNVAVTVAMHSPMKLFVYN